MEVQRERRSSEGGKFRNALKEEKPLQIVGAITGYTARMAEVTGLKALYLLGGSLAANSPGFAGSGYQHDGRRSDRGSQIGIYSLTGQLYEPEDAGSMLYYREERNGQLLEEGITEAGAISSWVAVLGAEGSRMVSFDQAIIAAGSEPVRLPFVPHDDRRVVDSTGALALVTIPERLLIIGGGVIGLEMATIYQALGSRITVVEWMDQIIPGADRDLVAPLQKMMSQRGIRFQLQTRLTRLDAHSEAIVALLAGPGGTMEEEFDMVLVAVGCRPNGRVLRAEAAGLTLASDGSIAVDAQMRTTVPHIFAIGDIVGQPMLAHNELIAEAALAIEMGADDEDISLIIHPHPTLSETIGLGAEIFAGSITDLPQTKRKRSANAALKPALEIA